MPATSGSVWGAQVHREPLRPWVEAFLHGRAALLPSDEHRIALYGAARAACCFAQWLLLPAGGLLVVPPGGLSVMPLSAYRVSFVSGWTL